MENVSELKLFFWVGTFVMSFSVWAFILMVILYRNKSLRAKRSESERLLKAALTSEKRERERIAADLHDGLSGDVAAIRNYIAILSQKEKNGQDEELLQEVENALGQILKSIQEISHDLMPPALEVLGLLPILERYFGRMQRLHKLSITLENQAEAIDIPPAKAYELYRIVQELVNNTIKHGKADQIHFKIYQKGGNPVFEIKDNGKPYQFYKSAEEPLGMGLKNIISRIAYIQANLIQIPVEEGNKIQIRLT